MEDDELDSRIDGLLDECNKLIDGRKTGEAVTEGIPAVICGKPNVGKSSFFNYLIGEDRAIVTDIPGTTRDMIEYQVKAGKIMLKLLDTAGIRENTSDIVEKMGIDAVKKRLSSDSRSIIFVLFTHDSFDTEKNEGYDLLNTITFCDKPQGNITFSKMLFKILFFLPCCPAYRISVPWALGSENMGEVLTTGP